MLYRFLDPFQGADLLCEHLRSYDYYMETITRGPCLMVGYVCPDWTSFLGGQCTDCGPRNERCLKFGEPAAEHKSLKDDSKSVIVYLKTGGYYPYCGEDRAVLVVPQKPSVFESILVFLSNRKLHLSKPVD